MSSGRTSLIFPSVLVLHTVVNLTFVLLAKECLTEAIPKARFDETVHLCEVTQFVHKGVIYIYF